MALFSLADISFSKKAVRGGSAADVLVGSPYERNTFRYPLDLGNYDKGHYMIIHINQQRRTQFKGETVSGALPTVLRNRSGTEAIRGSTNFGSSISSIVNNTVSSSIKSFANDIVGKLTNSSTITNTGSSNILKNILSGIGSGITQEIQSALSGITSQSFTRTIERTTDTIALYMPDTLGFISSQQYSTPSLSANPLVGMAAAGAAATETYKEAVAAGQNPEDAIKGATKNLAPFAFAALSKSQGDLGKVLFAAGTGLAINPMMEMIYSSPEFRSFRFDFIFYPRDEKEALEVQNILERLRFHQAPEIKSNSGGFFLIPPSEFDIKFYYNGSENPNIPKISTCVLRSIDIDYAPNGFAAYEIPTDLKPELGKTGMPVGIRLSLDFQETEIVTKELFGRRSFSSQK